MKKNYWLFLGMMLSSSLVAQTVSNAPTAALIATPAAAPAATISAEAPATNAPAAKPAKKKSAKKKSSKPAEKKVAEKKSTEKKPVAKKAEPVFDLKTTPLVPGPASVVASNVNVRGQAKLKSEVVTHIHKGQTVTVLEEIVRNDSGPEEPSAWAKILLPPGGHVWVNTMFIDAANHTVKPKKLNLRSGPGENYSVLGLLMRGDAVKEITTKGDWTEIDAPASSYAFVASQYLKQDAESAVVASSAAPTSATVAAVTPPPAPVVPEPPPTAATVASGSTIAPPPTAPPPVPMPAPAPAEPKPAIIEPVPAPAVAAMPEPESTEPPPPRIVQREGIVRGMTSIVAPSPFVLINAENRKDMDYLYTTSPSLDLRRYKGMRIIVIGEEGLDERWPNMPVLTIQQIKVVEEPSAPTTSGS
jgi:uncharacterized protein YgiM (DUF1202 family)